jgi:hypothetical protein
MAPKKKTATKKKDATEAPVVQDEQVVENDEHVLLHLPIHADRLSELTFSDTILEYNPVMCEPSPYDPSNQFISKNDTIEDDVPIAPVATMASASASCAATTDTETDSKSPQKCFWCCHDVGHEVFGMPIRYDALNKNFAMYGTFCSLECLILPNILAVIVHGRSIVGFRCLESVLDTRSRFVLRLQGIY